MCNLCSTSSHLLQFSVFFQIPIIPQFYQQSAHQRGANKKHWYEYNVGSFIRELQWVLYNVSLDRPFKCIKVHRLVRIGCVCEHMCVSAITSLALTAHIALHNRGGIAMKKDESWDWTEDTLPASGSRSVVFVWAAATDPPDTHHTSTLSFGSGFELKIWYLQLFSITIAFKLPTVFGHEDRRWPPFQPSRSPGSPRLLKKRKALVTALGFSPARHKMSPDTKPSHSYQRTLPALPANVTSFSFPPTATRKRKTYLTSTLPT